MVEMSLNYFSSLWLFLKFMCWVLESEYSSPVFAESMTMRKKIPASLDLSFQLLLYNKSSQD